MTQITRRMIFSLSMVIAVSFMLPSFASAAWPERPVSMIIMSKQGGGMDRASRLLGAALSEKLGQPVKYVNRPGASGEIALKMFMDAKSDGYTVFSGNISTLMMMYAMRDLDFTFSDKVTWLGAYLDDPALLVTPAASPYMSLEDFVAAAKKTKLRVGVANWASVQTLALLQLRDATGIQIEIIPYSGFKGASTALLGNHIESAVGNFAAVRKLGDGVRRLGIFAEKSPDPKVDIAPVGKTLGIDIMRAASVRALAVPTALKTSHPDRFEILSKAFNAVISDPTFTDNYKSIGASKNQAITWGEMEANKAGQSIVDKFAIYKSAFEKK